MTIKRVIARLHPVTMTPVVFMVDSKKDSQIDAFIDGQTKRVGIEVYQHSQKLTREDAIKVAKVFAEHENIPVEELLVRDRMPKTNKESVQHNRRTNDGQRATNDANLKLVDNGEKQTLAKAAQNLHDTATKGAGNNIERKANATHEAVHGKSTSANHESGRSTASNPEGAVVKPAQRTKRAYRKTTDKELSRRSAAALKRYQDDLAATAAKSPTMMEPVKQEAAPIDQKTIDEATLELALKLAAILKKNPGLI